MCRFRCSNKTNCIKRQFIVHFSERKTCVYMWMNAILVILHFICN